MKLIFLFYISLVGIIYAVLDALHDSYVIKNKSKQWHLTDAIIKTFMCINVGISFCFGYLFLEHGIFTNVIFLAGSISLYLMSWRLLIFDSVLNYFRNFDFNDIFKYKMWIPWQQKIIIFVVSTLIFVSGLYFINFK